MAHLTLRVDEAPRARDRMGAKPSLPRRVYLAVREVFKNGETYNPGDPIALDPETARRAIAAGDIKEMP